MNTVRLTAIRQHVAEAYAKAMETQGLAELAADAAHGMPLTAEVLTLREMVGEVWEAAQACRDALDKARGLLAAEANEAPEPTERTVLCEGKLEYEQADGDRDVYRCKVCRSTARVEMGMGPPPAHARTIVFQRTREVTPCQ